MPRPLSLTTLPRPPRKTHLNGQGNTATARAITTAIKAPSPDWPAVAAQAMRDLPTITSEVALRRIYERINLVRRNAEYTRAFLERAAELAVESGHSWTPLLDELTGMSGVGADMALEPTGLPEGARAALASACRWLQTSVAPSDMSIVMSFDSEVMSAARARYISAERLTTRAFGSLASGPRIDLLWHNPTLTDAQRETMVSLAIDQVRDEPDLLEMTPALECLTRFETDPSTDPDPETERVRPTDAQLRRLGAAVVQKALERLQEPVTVRPIHLLRDTLTLLAVPDLPRDVVESIQQGVLSRTETVRHDDVALGRLVAQAALTETEVATVLRTGRLSGDELLRALENRPELLRMRAVRTELSRGRPLSAVMRALLATAPESEFAPLLARAVASSPFVALDALESRSHSARPLDPTWLSPLLAHRSQAVRSRALLLTAVAEPEPATSRHQR